MSASPVTNVKLSGIQQPISPTLTETLSKELCLRIFVEAGNPHASEVCREWRELSASADQPRFWEYIGSDLIRPYMRTTIPPKTAEAFSNIVKETVQSIYSDFHHYFGKDNHDFANALLCTSSLEQMIQMINQRKTEIKEDPNLILLFDRLCEEIPIDQRPIMSGDLTETDRARFIRNWMQENQEILNTITQIHFRGLRLSSLPREIGKLVNLRDLYLPICSQLTSLPPEIGNLVNLRELLIPNKLTSLPLEIGNLVNLEFLYLRYNQLERFAPTNRQPQEFEISKSRT